MLVTDIAQSAKGSIPPYNDELARAVAEVANLDWFEDLRGKALRQRGLPSTKFLSTWRERLGTKERRTRDEADVEAVKRGLRAGLAAARR